MQRDTKFRAWREKRKVMSPVLSFFDWVDLGSACGEFIDKGDVKLMQFTGLKDKNGVEIYEGDILSHRVQGLRRVIYPMSDTFAGFGLIDKNGKKNTLNDSKVLYEVVGNIYENPELINS